MSKIGIIGGSGLDDPRILKDAREINVTTPFGVPSSPLTLGTISGVEVVLLSRHGRKHTIMPTNVPFRANIWALKEYGCTHVIASSACGSLREDIEPGHLVFPSQFIDRTTKRAATFFDQDRVCHISMEEPFCPQCRTLLAAIATERNFAHHVDRTVITIEGPRFSTRAESRMFRSWGADVINMSTVPEVVLAREAGMCYQVIAMATDYDCFMDHRDNVSWEQIVRTMTANVEKVTQIFVDAIPRLPDWQCACREAIHSALVG